MNRERLHRLIVIVFPALVQAAVVVRVARSMQAWDEFYYVPMLRQIGEGRPWLGWLWLQHNEHRIVWTKLLMLAHAPFSGWNPKVEMLVSAMLTGVISWGIWKLYRAAGGTRALFFWPVALLLCSLAQYMNMLYGIMTCHYFTIAGMVWALVFLTRGTWRSTVLAVGAGWFAMLSTLSAILIWPVGFVVLLLTRQSRAKKIFWIVAMIAVALLYFARYQNPTVRPPIAWSFHTLMKLALAITSCLGAPFAAGSPAWALSAGLIAIALALFAIAGVREAAQWSAQAGLIGLWLLGSGSAVLIGLGRFQYGLASGLDSKYVTYVTLALAAPYLMLVCQSENRLRIPLLAACLTLFFAGLLAANRYAWQDVQLWNQTRRMHRYLVQTIDSQPDENLTEVYQPSEVRQIAAYLRAAHLGPFRSRVDALLIPRWREGAPTAPITPGADIRAKLLCPVDTLRDVALNVTSSAAAGTLHMDVESEGRVYGQQSVSTAALAGTQWIPVPVQPPLAQCRGRELTVRVWVEGASALHAWTYPPYYGGVTRQGGVVIPRRDLGIGFNGFYNQLLP